MINFFKKKIRKSLAFSLIFLLLFLFFNIQYVKADNFVSDLLGAIGTATVGLAGAPLFLILSAVIVGISWLVGQISTLLILLLGAVAGYNSFIDEPVVIYGWVVVRDLCNMFFILILLVIAFAAILRIESYQWKKTLPKLLIMAVLINFSKTISGLIIDFAQVIMLTFFNGIKGEGGGFVDGTIVKALGLQNLLSFSTATIGILKSYYTGITGGTTPMTVFGSILFGLVLLVIACIVVGIYTMILFFRIIMLWILIILSPLAFLAMAFPAGTKYASQWWSEFIKHVIVGPVLIFFLWLALLMSQMAFSNSLNISIVDSQTAKSFQSGILTKAGEPTNLANFILVVTFLLAGLTVAQQVGASGGAMAGGMLGKIKSAGGTIGKAGLFKAGRMADTAQMKLQKGIMEGVFKVPEYHPKSLNYRAIAEGWKKSKAESMEEYESFGGKGAPLSTVWQETFKKNLRLKQFGTIRKSQAGYIEDKEQANKLKSQDEIDNNRIRFNSMSDDEREIELKKYDNDAYRQKKIADYNNKGYKGEEEVKMDEDILVGETFDAAAAEKRIKENKPKINKLMDPRALGKFSLISATKATPFEYEKSKAGAQEIIEKKTKEMETETGGVDFKVNNRLIKAIAENDTNNIVAALRIQNKNNNFNEILKDKRLVDLMTKSNGLLEKLNRQGVLAKGADGQGRKMNDDEMVLLKDDVRNRPVTPAHLQALVRGLLSNAGMKDNVAARHAADLGDKSFVAGNGLAFGMAMGDEASGDYKFENFDFTDGKLRTSERRKAAVAGKFSNVESQAKMRMMHPDLFISEDSGGNAVDLTDDGAYIMQSLSAHDLAQINRMRPDVINKIGASGKVIDEIKKLADRLEKEKNIEAANLIRYMGGYIVNSRMKPDLKKYREALETMGEKVKGESKESDES